MRAVIYARYSSELQRDASIEDQVRLCRQRIEQDGWEYLHAYTHRAVSGGRLFTLAEGEITELHVGLKGTMNALFLKDLADKTRRGLEGRVREGRSGGGLCFGYGGIREHG